MSARGDSPAGALVPAAHTPPGSLAIDHDIAWLRLDEAGKKVNTLSWHLLEWLEGQIVRLARDRPAGLVVFSGKPDGFVAGADLGELARVAQNAQSGQSGQSGESSECGEPGGRAELLGRLRRGHELLTRLSALPFPTVAAIHGACLGGGLELALACRCRVATSDRRTLLGLPEVRLGLIPGLGGTQRLPRLIGVVPALDLILTGKRIDARQARRLGLVDDVCPPVDLARAAELVLRRGAAHAGVLPRARRLAVRAGDLIACTPFVGELVWNRARRSVQARTGGHYPAPRVALAVVREGIRLPLARALDLEAGAFVELAVSPVARNLISVFLAQNQAEGRAAAIQRKTPTEGPRAAAVLGAGLMGAGIAQALAARGIAVVLKEKDEAALARGLRASAVRFAEMVARRQASAAEAELGMARIRPTLDYRALSRAELVIEAVFEDLAVKHAVLRETEEVAPEGLIFASNTSSIPIASIAEASRRPESVVGMHFFSPVHKMPLLEVVRHARTSPRALATAVQVGRTLGKTVIVVSDGPGFFTTRVLVPFLNEAAWLLGEGASIDRIDRVLTRWGWPVGPFTLLDEVGLDVGAHVAQLLHATFGDRLAPPPAFSRLLAAGRLGRKAGRGFYRYREGGRSREGGESSAGGGNGGHGGDLGGRGGGTRRHRRLVDAATYALLDWRPAPLASAADGEGGERSAGAAIADRCWLQMLNEAARCLADGIVERPADADVGVIFGLGFPAFRGGLLRHADHVGLANVVDRLDTLAERHGVRFTPAPLLRDMAERGGSFYPAGS